MSKTSPDALLAEIADDFHTYLRKGVRFERVIGKAHPELDIDDLETLLRIHFVLTERADESAEVGVVDFVRDLEERIRRMKTTTTTESTERRGEVRGHIDWRQTVKTRSMVGRLDEPIFVTDQPEEHYDIDENLVLKRLLTIIQEIVFDDLEYALDNADGYSWLSAWVAPDLGTGSRAESTAAMFWRVFEQNIYLQRIDLDASDVTDRMIEAVKQSRSEFYREAAVLLDRYRQLMQQELSGRQARELLNNTLLAPDRPEVLFELYWIFRVLDAYEGVTYRVLRGQPGDSSVIAEWEDGEAQYVLSHDSTGTALTFAESMDSIDIEDDGYLYRMNQVRGRWEALAEELFGADRSGPLWGGHPDIVIERFVDGPTGTRELETVFVGEVKYTQNTGYALTGLRELLEYMAFTRESNSGLYVEPQETVLDSVNVRGLLFVDELEIDSQEPESISVVQYGDEFGKVL